MTHAAAGLRPVALTIEEIIEARKAVLTAYQDAAYPERYTSLERIAA